MGNSDNKELNDDYADLIYHSRVAWAFEELLAKLPRFRGHENDIDARKNITLAFNKSWVLKLRP